MQEDFASALRQGVADLDEDEVLTTVRAALRAGVDPAAIIAACEEGMRLVGEQYETGEYYLSGLITAGEIFREVLETVQPVLEATLTGHASGRVLLGTVQGDIHDIGKAILEIALSANGFAVRDLGVDASPQAFVENALAWQPDIIALSGLITPSYDSMKATVDALAAAGLRDRITIVIGGGIINEQVRAFVGADSWCNNALDGARLFQRIVDRAAGQARQGTLPEPS